MADSIRVCVFLCFLYNFCAAVGSKEFFCQDPDTGELHHVNTTWSSTRFCGNYTCKLKKRIVTDMDNQASSLNDVLASNPYDERVSFPEDNKAEISITTKRELPEATTRNNLENDFLSPKRASDKDRYLNDAEIKSISELLHTIKKSDIDAIVEVYNLAQDIYKEMETTTTNNEIKFNEVKFAERKNPRTSYWYDPGYLSGDFTFDRVKDITLREQPDPVPLASKFYPIYSTPYTEKLTIPYTVLRQPVPTLPYYPYYPLPVQSVPAVQRKLTPVQDIWRSYQYKGNHNQPCPWSNKVLKKQYSHYPYSQRMESVAKLLPLPFSYFNNYDQYFLKLYSQQLNSTQQNHRLPYTKMEAVQPKSAITEPKTLLTGLPDKTFSQSVTQSSNLDILNEARENDIIKQKDIRATKEPNTLQDTLSKSLREKQNKMAPWQTLPLSQKILDDVKANILESSDNLLKPFTLKKKLRLGRVAKVLKLDDLERKRREIVEVTRGDVLEENDFEVFLEKITCEVGTDPGLFSLGDLSLPFPACCPQKLNIEDESTRTNKRPVEFTTSNTLGIGTLETNAECTENATVTVPIIALSSDVSSSNSLPTALSPSADAETLKLTTNSLGISTLSSTAEVVEFTVKTSSSTPQTTTSDSPPTVSKTTLLDDGFLELSVLPSKSSNIPEFPILSSKIPELSVLPSKTSKMPEFSILPFKTSKVTMKSSSLGSSTERSTTLSSVYKGTITIPTVSSSLAIESDLSTSTAESNVSTEKSSKLNKFSHLKVLK